MKLKKTDLAGCFVLEHEIFEDDRGSFYESYNKEKFEALLGFPVNFVQDNHSVSQRGVLRGLHFQQSPYEQSKLVRVVRGEAIDVVIDIRKDSPTFGRHFKIRISQGDNISLFIPKGMAHGFLALKDQTVFVYKCDHYYHKESERGIMYNDPDLRIDWEADEDSLILSDKDRKLPSFKDLLL
ncbi:MAG: dTDP-4-dehydrorhamnose 3,5-epimerase [Flavobacteriaceae bacterium]